MRVERRASMLRGLADSLVERVDEDDTLAILRVADSILTHLQWICAETIEEGARRGFTQKQLAEAAGVPASALRGLGKSVR